MILSIVLLIGAPSLAAPWPRHTIDASDKAARKLGADGVRLGDVNGDGRMDVVTGWEEGGTISVCVHPGAQRVKAPWPSVVVGRVKSPEDAVFVDLDGDGQLDVVSSCEGGTRNIFAHWAPADGADYLKTDRWRTQAFGKLPRGQQWMFATPAVIKGKSIDLVVGSKGKAVVGWLERPAETDTARDADAWTYHPIGQAGWIMSIETMDLDGDGDNDVIISDRKGTRAGVWWLENPGDHAKEKAAQWNRHLIDAKGMEVMFLDVVDFDGDGRKDVIVATRIGSIVMLWQRDGGAEALSWAAQTIANPLGVKHGKAVRAGDMDGDGDLDLVHTTNTQGAPGKAAVCWLENQGEGKKWRTHAISDEKGRKFDLIELVDLDDDGDLDVMTCEERDNLGVVWYENRGGGG